MTYPTIVFLVVLGGSIIVMVTGNKVQICLGTGFALLSFLLLWAGWLSEQSCRKK